MKCNQVATYVPYTPCEGVLQELSSERLICPLCEARAIARAERWLKRQAVIASSGSMPKISRVSLSELNWQALGTTTIGKPG